MRIAISSTGPDLQAQVAKRFGRCKYLVFVDTDSQEYESVINTAAFVSAGAGVPAAMLTVNRGAKAVLTGEIGPTAAEVLADAGIRVFVRGHGKLSDAVQGLNEGRFPRAFCPTVTCGFGEEDER